MRRKLRKLNELPRCKKSNTDMDDPKRVQVTKLMWLPMRPKLRKLRLLPKCTKSMTENRLPRRA
jgi:hypothetical protein